jgi:hypothetical protein
MTRAFIAAAGLLVVAAPVIASPITAPYAELFSCDSHLITLTEEDDRQH